MLPKCIEVWNNIITNCTMTNTYKMAWARAIIECIVTGNYKTDIRISLNEFLDKNQQKRIVINFKDIAELVLKYYWNQTIFFDLNQGSNLNDIPKMIKDIKSLIESYFERKGNKQPKRQEKIDFDDLGLLKEYNTCLDSIEYNLTRDVCWRFKELYSLEYDLYEYERRKNQIIFNEESILLLKGYSDLLFNIINYRWAQKLEKLNHSPRISMKVKTTDHKGKIKRGDLEKFHKYLEYEFKDKFMKCFFCNKEILSNHVKKSQKLSIDHVIPWSYLYSDDIWNLVFCHQGENSKKSNRIPSMELIEKLEVRNKLLFDKLKKSEYYNSKISFELEIAIKRDYVRQFWIGCKG